MKAGKELSVIWHFIKLAYRIHPGYIPLAIVSAVVDAVSPFLGIVMPGYILNELAGTKRIDRLILYISILIAGNGILGFAGSVIRKNLQMAGIKLADGFEMHVGYHIMHMDLEKLEDAKILDMKEKALFNMRLHDALLSGPKTIVDVFRLIIILAGVTGLIAISSPVLVAALALLIAVNALIYKRIQATKLRFYQDIAVYNRQFKYFQDLTQDFKNAKDVRIYRMSEYIIGRIDHYQNSVNNIFNKMFLKQRCHDGFSAVTIKAQTLTAYAFAVWNVLCRKIMIGDFTVYISAANQFSDSAVQLMEKIVDLQMLGRVLQDYLAFEQLPNSNLNGKRILADMGSPKIEFKNVWFKYPNAEDYALKDVSLTLNKGESLSVVGKNGAGKTTFIKLLCRLYRPEKGCILLNGVDINEFEEREYCKLLAVIFQDFKIFSFSIKENLIFDGAVDEKRVRTSLKQAGILEKTDELPMGADTPLYKNFDKNGVELSGGEMQKIAIARALYKDAPVVVLDEPTAALDPYSEYEIFSRFNEMTKGKTAIYISHRLSSCRFCDAVAVFDNGILAEYGSHEQLVHNGGLYAKMWKAQAQFF